MFCTRCGKKLDYNSIICNECLQAEGGFFNEPPKASADRPLENEDTLIIQAQNQNYSSDTVTVESTPAQRGSRMKGFLGALLSFIFSIVSTLISIMVLYFSALNMGISMAFGDYSSAIIGLITMIFITVAIVLCIFSIILGIKSTITFKRSSPKPIATLILGILGLEGSIVAIVYAILADIFVSGLLITVLSRLY